MFLCGLIVYRKSLFSRFNGLYTPFGSPVIGGQKRYRGTETPQGKKPPSEIPSGWFESPSLQGRVGRGFLYKREFDENTLE